MAYDQEGAVRKFQAAKAQGREKLGLPAQYGAPVMMPPTNRLGGALQIASQVASIYSGFGGAGLFKFGGANAAANAAQVTSIGGGLANSSTLLNAPVLQGGLFAPIGIG